MKRDLDLIRHILVTIESSDSNKLSIEDFVTDEYPPEQIAHHIRLLLDVDYIEATEVSTLGCPYRQFLIRRITMDGYEYLDSVRDPKVWSETKSKLAQATSSISLDIIKTVASKVISGMLGI